MTVVDDRKRKAYADLEQALHALLTIAREDEAEDGDSPEALTDWVIVTGSQFYDEDGDRAGAVTILPRDGSQPAYITVGLLREALGKY